MPLRFPRFALLSLLAVAAGCVPRVAPPPPPPTPAPTQAPAPAPSPRAVDWQDWPVTPGTWRYAREATGSSATFGADQAALRCQGGAVRLTGAPGGQGAVTIRTTSATRTLPTGADGAVSLSARDPLLDAIVFSRGRFTIERAGAATLVLPPWAEVARVVEDCRG